MMKRILFFWYFALNFYLPSLCFASSLENIEQVFSAVSTEEVSTCTVCFEPAHASEGGVIPHFSSSNIGSQGAVRLDCGHIFHRECIDNWVYDYANFVCPNCRENIVPVFLKLNYKMKYEFLNTRYSRTFSYMRTIGCWTFGLSLISVGGYFTYLFFDSFISSGF